MSDKDFAGSVGVETHVRIGLPPNQALLSAGPSGTLLAGTATVTPAAIAFAANTKSTQRTDAQLAAQGYYSENFPRQAVNSSTVPTSGTIYFCLLGLLAGDVVTNLNLLCTTLGTGFSGINMRVALYSKASVQLATSGDVSAQFGSTGTKPCPLTTPYTVPTTDAYFAALIQVGSANVALLRGSPGLNAGGAIGSGTGAYGAQTGQTDLTAPATIAFNNTGNAFWFGIS